MRDQRVWLAAVVMLVLGGATIGAAFSGGPSRTVDVSGGPTPGFVDATTTTPRVDGSEIPTTLAQTPTTVGDGTPADVTTTTDSFTMAGPNADPARPTTIPPERFPGNSTPIVTTTSTTIVAPIPQAPPGDDVCLALNRFFNFVRLVSTRQLALADLVRVVQTSVSDIDVLLTRSDADAYRPIMAILDDVASRVSAASDVDSVYLIVGDLVNPANQQVGVAVEPLVAHASRSCPALSPA